MKKIINSLGIGLMIAFAMIWANPVKAQPRVGVSINFQTFYDELSPHGDWIDYPEYGYTWRPRVGTDFRPYSTNGSWAYTADNDWMWNSGYNWGWAPFHYGRWFYDPFYGWLWVPGYEWSPAWVSWRGGGDYYGWAPIRPGISIGIGFGSYNPPYDYWTFAPCRYMTSRYIGRYYHPYRNNVTIFNRTTIINNYYGPRGGGNDRGRGYYTNGPRRGDVERYTGRINAVTVRNADRPGRATVSRNAVSVYRPAVSRGDSRGTYAPRNVQRYERDNSVVNRGTTRNDRSSDVRSSTGNRVDRVNTAPRREDAINNERNNNAREDGRRQETSSRRFDNNGDRSNDRNEQLRQRNTEMRERQVQMQRSQEARQSNDRAAEMRQQNEEMQRRSAEMRQQREARAQQENNQRAEAAQRATQQRSAEMRQQQESRERAEAQQRATRQQEARAQQESRERAVQQRESQNRSREVQVQRPESAPRVESRAPNRSFESRGSSPGRSSGGGGGERSSSRGGDRGGRGR